MFSPKRNTFRSDSDLNDGGLPGREISLVVIDSAAETVSTIGRIIEEHCGGAEVVGTAASFERGYQLILEKRPLLVIMEAEDEDMTVPLGRMNAILSRFPKTSIFVTGKNGSAETILSLLRAGATEYLSKPISEDDLKAAIQKLLRYVAPPPVEDGGGLIYSVFSPKGGTGVTTMAVNLAVNIYEGTGKPTILVDLDHTAGDVATFLGLEPAYTVSDCLAGEDLDRGLLQKKVARHKSGIYVLPQLLTDEAVPPSVERVKRLLDVLKSTFSYVVLDTEPAVSEATIAAMQLSDLIFMMFVMSLPSIKNTRKYLEYLFRMDIRDNKILPVANRYELKGDITIQEAESALRKRIFCHIPNDYALAMESLNSAMPFTAFAPQSGLNLAIKDLAGRITGGNVEGTNEAGETSKVSPFGFLTRNFFRRFVEG